MRRIFEKVGLTKPKYSGFDLSHEKKLSMDMGDLIPVLCEPVLPGDKFKVRSEVMIRMAPMLAPVMHRVNAFLHYFFVPNRLLWDSWEDFITGGEDGTAAPTFPTITMSAIHTELGNTEGELPDYLGLPTIDGAVTGTTAVSQLPFRAYQQIFNDYYRDQTLKTIVDYTTTAGLLTRRARAWEKDYFTSALPWAQRGTAPTFTVDETLNNPSGGEVKLRKLSDDTTLTSMSVSSDASGNLEGGSTDAYIDQTEISTYTADIAELRRTSAIQRWLEKQARGGARYIETIKTHFGITSSDARMQRAEYLGGERIPMVISEVLNTSATATEPQGDMAGHGS